MGRVSGRSIQASKMLGGEERLGGSAAVQLQGHRAQQQVLPVGGDARRRPQGPSCMPTTRRIPARIRNTTATS
eukprot:77745-Pyramimonas_sp.AAC.1